MKTKQCILKLLTYYRNTQIKHWKMKKIFSSERRKEKN